MVTLEDLKAIPMLRELDDDFLKKMAEISFIKNIDAGEVLYRENEEAKYLYIMKSGKGLFETDITDEVSLFWAPLKPGYFCGWYALLPNAHYGYGLRTVISEPSEIIAISGEKLQEILEENSSQGFIFMRNIFMLTKMRLDRKVKEFAYLMRRHPDLALEK